MNRKLYLLRLIHNGLINHLLQNFSLQLHGNIFCKPEAIDIFPTYRCNLRCRQCAIYEHRTNEVTFDKWKEIIANLERWLGHFRLRICGGEPFMREDLLEIIRYSHRLGIVTILTTNGSLIDKNIAEKIIESGLDFISISLDSLKEEPHDFLRGFPGTHKKIMQAIEYMKGKITIQICTTIMSYNLDEILNLLEFVERNKLKISFQGLIPQLKVPIDSFDFQNFDLWPKDRKKIDYIFSELFLRKKRNSNITNSYRHLELIHSYYKQPRKNINYSCQAHKSNFIIMPNGNVKFCSRFRPIGNIAFDLPQKIWKSKEAALIREEMKDCCRNCTFIRYYYYETLPEKISRFKNIFLTTP